MSSLQINPQNVYQGFWIDWSYGRIMGSTITTTQSLGTLAVAALAILVQITGSHLWDIAMFLMHLSSANKMDKNGLHRQQQMLFRNSKGPRSLVFDLFRVFLAWRHLIPCAKRQIYIFLLALLIGLGFIVASILTTFVVTGLDIQILANSRMCGYYDWGHYNRTTGDVDTYVSNLADSSWAYSRNCYMTNESNVGQCSVFATPRLHFDSFYNISCPFQNSICKGQTNSAMAMDTGLLDSHSMFGFNARPTERIQFRKRTTCAPIMTDGFMEVDDCSLFSQMEQTSPSPSETCFYWYYGPVTSQPASLLPPGRLPSFWRNSYETNRTYAYKTQ